MVTLIFVKSHGSGANSILAACDKELCGKTLKCEKIEFFVSEKFYNGEEISLEKLKEMLHDFENINLVGNRAVQAAIEEGLAAEESVIKIGKIKHVQIFKI